MNVQAPARKSPKSLIPRRTGETDEERRLREAINRHCGQVMSAVDAALALRNAPQDAQRERHVARGHLVDFGLHALNALNWVQDDGEES